MHRTLLRPFVAATVVAAALVPTGSTALADGLPAPWQMSVRLTASGVKAPDSLVSGRYRVEVQAPRRSFGLMLLVKPDRGYTRADLRADDRGGAAGIRRIRENIRFFGGVEVRPGRTGVLWETLYEGRYWVLGINSGRPRGIPIATVHVHGTPSLSSFPRISGDATTSRDAFRMTRTLPQAGRLLIRNESRRDESLVLLRLRGGDTYEDFVDAVRHPRTGTVQVGGFHQTLPLTGGAGYVLRYRLRQGRYVVMGLEGFGRLLVGRKVRHIRELTEPLTVRAERRSPRASDATRPAHEGFLARRGSAAAPTVDWPAWAVR